MIRYFDPEYFLRRMRQGAFHGRLDAELRRLSTEELIALLKAKQVKSLEPEKHAVAVCSR